MNKRLYAILSIVVAALTLAGCGSASRVSANFTGYSESCVAGVAYLQFPSGVTVKYGKDGKIVTC